MVVKIRTQLFFTLLHSYSTENAYRFFWNSHCTENAYRTRKEIFFALRKEASKQARTEKAPQRHYPLPGAGVNSYGQTPVRWELCTVKNCAFFIFNYLPFYFWNINFLIYFLPVLPYWYLIHDVIRFRDEWLSKK